MFGLTPFGIFHTIISLMAVAIGAIALLRDGQITWSNSIGKWYIILTVIVCLTGFGIFQHGGFGKPHALGIITLLVIGLIFAATRNGTLFGRFTPQILVALYTLTYFFHVIPGVTETATRLPISGPLASSPDDPAIQKAVGFFFVVFAIIIYRQVRRVKS